MGIRAREWFDIGVDDFEVVSMAGSQPPVSCLNDGLQTATGSTLGHGLISIADTDTPRPEATFRFKDDTIRISLKEEYADRIRRDCRRGVEIYGADTPQQRIAAAENEHLYDQQQNAGRKKILILFVELGERP